MRLQAMKWYVFETRGIAKPAVAGISGSGYRLPRLCGTAKIASRGLKRWSGTKRTPRTTLETDRASVPQRRYSGRS